MLLQEIIGQDHIVSALQQALKQGKVVHGYLFSGTDGLGKRSTAEALGAALLCEAKPNEGCGVCESCRRLAHDNHPDFHRLRAEEGQIGIDEIRQLQQVLSLQPYRARCKVALIEDAERMTAPAANAILKLLEEPVGNTVIILTTSNLFGILPTIVSRCQVYRFHPVPTEILAAALLEHGLTEEEAWDRAIEARGVPGRALTIISEENHWSLQKVAAFLDRLLSSDATWVLRQTDQWGYDAQQAGEFLLALEDWFRMILIFQATNHSELRANPLFDTLQTQARKLPGDLLIEFQEQIKIARHALSIHVNVRLTLDALCLQIQARAQQVSGKGA